MCGGFAGSAPTQGDPAVGQRKCYHCVLKMKGRRSGCCRRLRSFSPLSWLKSVRRRRGGKMIEANAKIDLVAGKPFSETRFSETLRVSVSQKPSFSPHQSAEERRPSAEPCDAWYDGRSAATALLPARDKLQAPLHHGACFCIINKYFFLYQTMTPELSLSLAGAIASYMYPQRALCRNRFRRRVLVPLWTKIEG